MSNNLSVIISSTPVWPESRRVISLIAYVAESRSASIHISMGVDPRKNVEGTLPSLICPPLPLEVVPLKSR